MDQKLFVKTYLERIYFIGDLEFDLHTLSALQRLHLLNIPFENTYVLNNENIVLEKEWLFDKVIVRKRGGFCFELNYLFSLLLSDLGFDVTLLGGRVFKRDTVELGIRNEHIIILVTLRNKKQYLVDVAFSGKAGFCPLPLEYDQEISDPNGIFKLVKVADNEVKFECKAKNIIDKHTGQEFMNSDQDWINLYQFCLNPMESIQDTQTAFDYYTTNDGSLFKKGFYMFKMTETGKVTMLGNVFTKYTSDGNLREISERDEIDSENIQEIFSKHFGLV